MIARATRCVLLVALVAAASDVAAQAPPASAVAADEFVPPDDYPAGWYARIETSEGRIVALLHPEQAPQAVAYFAALASGSLEWLDPVSGKPQKTPYYDGIEVHYAKAAHLFEAGYRPGSTVAPELYVPFEGRSGPLTFDYPGRLGLSPSGAGIGAVVFFITASPIKGLAARHPCFGTVVSDREVVWRIAEVKTDDRGRPLEPVRIEKVRIFSVGDPPPLPAPVPFVPQRIELKMKSPPPS
jgi:peptidyl-prolyl cis-trans isomerase A (cyclophilin A)